jgi:hypothetical protein
MDGGSLVQWSAVLADVLKLDFDVVTPASGPPVSRNELQAYKAKLDGFISRANALVKQGVPKDQLLLQLNKDDAGLRLSLTPGQLDYFYAELSSRKVANR